MKFVVENGLKQRGVVEKFSNNWGTIGKKLPVCGDMGDGLCNQGKRES